MYVYIYTIITNMYNYTPQFCPSYDHTCNRGQPERYVNSLQTQSQSIDRFFFIGSCSNSTSFFLGVKQSSKDYFVSHSFSPSHHAPAASSLGFNFIPTWISLGDQQPIVPVSLIGGISPSLSLSLSLSLPLSVLRLEFSRRKTIKCIGGFRQGWPVYIVQNFYRFRFLKKGSLFLLIHRIFI